MMACGVDRAVIPDNTTILKTVMGNAFQLSIMEALFIRELTPGINKKDEYWDYELILSIC